MDLLIENFGLYKTVSVSQKGATFFLSSPPKCQMHLSIQTYCMDYILITVWYKLICVGMSLYDFFTTW